MKEAYSSFNAQIKGSSPLGNRKISALDLLSCVQMVLSDAVEHVACAPADHPSWAATPEGQMSLIHLFNPH